MNASSTCSVKGCDRPRKTAKSGSRVTRYLLCGAHKSRLDRYGDVQADRPVGGYSVETPCSYDAAHYRVNARRGLARLNQCLNCDQTASGWAYRGGAAYEFTEQRGVTELRYSGDPADYDPMCSKCHKIADVAVRRVRVQATEDALAAALDENAALRAENEVLRGRVSA